MDTTQLEKRIKDLENKLEEINKKKVVVFTQKNASTITATSSIKVIIDGRQYEINVL